MENKTKKKILRKNKKKKNSIYFVFYGIAVIITLASCLWFASAVIIYTGNIFHHSLIACGLSVQNPVISGNQMIKEAEILSLLSKYSNKSMLSFSVWTLKKELESNLPWIQEVYIKRKLPNTLLIEVKEYVPFAIWNNKYILDKEINIIDTVNKVTLLSNYPLLKIDAKNLTGLKEIGTILLSYPEISISLEKLKQVANRRWDLYLKNGTLIKLPDDNLKEAFNKIISLNRKYNLLSNNNIKYLDFRINDKTFFVLKEH